MKLERIIALASALGAIFYFAGCAQLGEMTKKLTSAAPKAEQASAQAPAKPSAESAEPASPVRVLDRGEEQRLSKSLVARITTYYNLLEDKEVEKASMFVREEHRAKFVDDLWDFVAKYKIQSADIVSYQLHPQADGLIIAQAKVMRTLFKHNEITPARQPIYMMWEYDGSQWLLRPQVEK